MDSAEAGRCLHRIQNERRHLKRRIYQAGLQRCNVHAPSGFQPGFLPGEKITLPDVPIRREGQIYITPNALSKLLQTEVGWNPSTGEINIAAPSDRDTTANTGAGEAAKPLRIQSVSNVDTGELIAYAKKYLGVPYDFGAGPYEETKRFDCSSFTRHVFKKFGVDLPRLAKDQDNIGRRISRSELEPGDLIFFTVPGRFESDAIPGHVGIYMGAAVSFILGAIPEYRSVTWTAGTGVMLFCTCSGCYNPLNITNARKVTGFCRSAVPPCIFYATAIVRQYTIPSSYCARLSGESASPAPQSPLSPLQPRRQFPTADRSDAPLRTIHSARE